MSKSDTMAINKASLSAAAAAALPFLDYQRAFILPYIYIFSLCRRMRTNYSFDPCLLIACLVGDW
jgi:hypothetical protein